MSARDAGFAVTTDKTTVVRRIGVLGCGRIGRMHADILATQVPGFEVVAVADVVPAAAEAVAAATGARVSAIDELIGADDIDTVAICTSTDTHVELVVKAAAAGKAIFCEKPVSLDIGLVDTALAAVEQAGVPFMIG
ncbi:MAG TPA: Gfo/Idh/MocA family oxidoreductase, partial [Dermatophilaceae bacterium]|nr:Gfo/Idh/MocA family oxidoreductase [Dermatophilaceae bacterium]